MGLSRGMVISGETPSSVPKNAGGVTPMTSVGTPLKLMVLPTAGPLPKRLAQNAVNISARVKIQLLSKESEDPGKGLRLLAQLIEKLRGNIGHLDARARHHLDGPQAPGVMHGKGLQ